MEKILNFARELIKKNIQENSIWIDATCGRGNDTLFLAQNAEVVYAFDIQKEAINDTKEKVKNYNNVFVINDSHENHKKYINEKIDGVMFNLGYLPKGDKQITTKAIIVLNTLNELISQLKKNGLITIVCYPGHPEGLKESKEITSYCQKLNQKEFDVIKYNFINQINDPPFLLAIQKIR